MTGLAKFSRLKFNTDQLAVATALEHFTQSDKQQLFVLDGYAGTGKTSLIAAYIQYLKTAEINVVLLASTGRAAKVLAEKANFAAETIHRQLYVLDEDEIDDIRKERRLAFKLRENNHSESTLYIVDESSMISDHASKNLFLNFGTGRLLSDLMGYANGRKIIFVGDSSQLPPVNVKFPPVFKEGYFSENFSSGPNTGKLRIQERFAESSPMFMLAVLWRKAIEMQKRLPLKIETGNNAQMQLHESADNMASQFAGLVRAKGIDESLFICFSNKRAFELNNLIRARLFPRKTMMQKGEVLIVVYNNYRLNITNGEHIIVDEIEHTEQRAGLTFRHIKGRVKDFKGYRSFSARIIEDLLYQPLAGLTIEQEADLYIDFKKRMWEAGVSPKSEDFLLRQVNDPYLNAIRTKYGYAITCHRAQGGEWSDVFIDFENALLMQPPDFYLRWAYTSVSRATEKLHFLKKSFIH
jgi:ATP-dependent exoDNAse (exonuclease V) alpha subunit